jgi:hypothetical protein
MGFEMTLINAVEIITQYLGSEPKPFPIDSFDGVKDFNGKCWDLPPQKDEDKPLHIRYIEIENQIQKFGAENKRGPQFDLLIEEAYRILKEVPITTKFGVPVITIDDLLMSDPGKGIRNEWWLLRSMLAGEEVCLFLDYTNIETNLSKIHDKLILMPNVDQYEYLRINETRGNNHPVETEQIIKVMRNIEDEYGLAIIRASYSLVEFIIEKRVDAKGIPIIRQQLHQLCPSAESLTSNIRCGRVELWWD